MQARILIPRESVGGLLTIQPHGWITLTTADEKQNPEQVADEAAGLTIGGCSGLVGSTGGSVLQVDECGVRCKVAACSWEGILCHG
jgi:hypothetical protein